MTTTLTQMARAAYEVRFRFSAGTISPPLRWATWEELSPASQAREIAGQRAAVEVLSRPPPELTPAVWDALVVADDQDATARNVGFWLIGHKAAMGAILAETP